MSARSHLPPTISVEEAGTILGISRRAAYRAVHRGELPAVRIGRRLLVPSARLLHLLGLDPNDWVEDATPRQLQPPPPAPRPTLASSANESRG
ncbi:helix-turn-helix domain-containing protein [Nitriliruptoria bacterium AS10]|nr:helix-turn-helix domain-containing protein [Salsipaludibacter albus]